MSAERDKSGDVTKFPPMTELAHFHNVVGSISDAIGDDANNVPEALLCLIVRDGEVQQFTMMSPDQTLMMIGALELAKIGMLDDGCD